MTPPTTAVVEKIEELLKKAGEAPWIVDPGPYEVPVVVDAWGNRIVTGADSLKDSVEDSEDRISQYQLICLLRNSIQGLLEERKRHISALKEIDWILSVAKGREPSSEAKVRIEGVAKEALSPAGENGGKA